MENLQIILNSNPISFITYFIKSFILNICTYYTFFKILNIKKISKTKYLFIIFITFIITFLCTEIKYISNAFTSTLCIIVLLSTLYAIITNNKFGYCILTTIVALSINYFIHFFAIVIDFIPNALFAFQTDIVNLLLIIIIHILLLFLMFKIPKFKYGFSFFTKNLNNEYFDILILNISVAVLFSFIALTNLNLILNVRKSFFFYFMIFSYISVITIQKTFTMYYKHKLLVTELNDTKSQLEEKNKEIADLEAENLEFSKTSHSIAHKQKSLEHKLNKLMLQTEVADELDLRDRLDDISNEYSKNVATTPIAKTEIEIIDDMVSCMNAECKENNIDFELQSNGNIYHMINTFVSKEELEILLADHIKDSIIAINYSDNVNKSILVKLGLFDGEYKLSIYDSGIEFEIETLINLGIKPSTTHSDNGGTGMGFMNTFDTLRKHSASLYINEIGVPTKDNYTKSVTISFNDKNEYKITSYRANEIKEKNNRNDLIIE